MGNDKYHDIIQRIRKTLQGKEVLESLVDLNNADFQSLLLEVFHQRASKIPAPQILQAYQQNPFVKPSALSFRDMFSLDQQLMDLLPEQFEMMELSPLSPLGTCSALGTVSQNKVVSALKNSEVMADATNLMALECAHRRQQLLQQKPKNRQSVHLATSHRLVRNQPQLDPNYSPHFRIFGLCSAGRDRGSYQFEMDMLVEHIKFYENVFKALNSPRDYELVVQITCWSGPAKDHQETLLNHLRAQLPALVITAYPERPTGKSYYPDICFQITLQFAETAISLVDGGFTNWTQNMLNNHKERLLISGIGTELCIKILEL